jgi:predicted acylesterase/phospholipase RssA
MIRYDILPTRCGDLLVAIDERGLVHVDFVAGISAGSSNAVNYLSRDPARARRSFVDFADDPRFGNWLSFVMNGWPIWMGLWCSAACWRRSRCALCTRRWRRMRTP